MQSVLLFAFVSTAVPAASSASAQESPCSSGIGTCPETLLQDEVSLLQKTDQFKLRSNTQAAGVANDTQLGKGPGSGGLIKAASLQSTLVSQPGGISNIVYVRVCKTGSTSTASAIRRIADHEGLSGTFEARSWPGDIGEPGIWANHGALDTEEFGPNPANEPTTYDDGLPSTSKVQGLKKPYFMATVIRDPAKRAMSKYYFNTGCAKYPGQVITSKKDFLRNFQNNMFRYIRSSATDTLDDIFNAYGLVGITERLDESLVVLAASLKVPLSDVLYLSAKNSSAGFTVGKDDKNKCEAHPSMDEEPDDVKQFLATEFAEANDLDYQLVARADATLDAKIEEMNLKPAIEKFQDLLAKAQKTCDVDSGSDLLQNVVECYVEDEGCNYKCLNQFDQIGRDMCEWCD